MDQDRRLSSSWKRVRLRQVNAHNLKPADVFQDNVEVPEMQFDRRFWMAVGAVLLIIIIVYGGGYLGDGGEPKVAPTQQEAPAQTQ
jgi:hypothetical protein